MKFLIALTLSACAAVDTTENFVTGHGDVYDCEGVELCWNGSEETLESLTGLACGPTDRLWPKLVGCSYHCEGDYKGCNAHDGCFCPAPEPTE